MFEAEIGSMESEVKVDKVTVDSLLSKFESAIGLDISKRSTGCVIWYNGVLEKYKIKLEDNIDIKNNPLAEEKMRREFKQKLLEVIKGRNFQYGVVENVFGGENFDTVRKLLALNTVFDGIILDGSCSVEHYYKKPNQEWKKYFGKITHIEGAPTDKFKIQQIFEYLEFDYYMQNKDLSDSEKENTGFQDILDATGLLCALSVELDSDIDIKKKPLIPFNKLNIKYYDSEDEFEYDGRMSRVHDLGITLVTADNIKDVKKFIVNTVNEDTSKVYMIEVPNDKLGYFALEKGIEASPYGSKWILAYVKGLFSNKNKQGGKQNEE